VGFTGPRVLCEAALRNLGAVTIADDALASGGMGSGRVTFASKALSYMISSSKLVFMSTGTDPSAAELFIGQK
jgi:hypothetical protein